MNEYSYVNEIYPGLWLGDIESSKNIEFLKGKNITCVVNCTKKQPFSDLISNENRLRVFVDDNLKSNELYNMYLQLDGACRFIYDKLPYSNILVHCHAGRQRSVAVISAFFIKYADFEPEYVVKLIRTKRPVAGKPNINFLKSIKQYYSDLKGRNQET